jgi:hypothetical protein
MLEVGSAEPQRELMRIRKSAHLERIHAARSSQPRFPRLGREQIARAARAAKPMKETIFRIPFTDISLTSVRAMPIAGTIRLLLAISRVSI